MSSETVNPTLAAAPPTNSPGQLTTRRGPRIAGRVAIQEEATIPSGLPTT